MEVTDGSSNSGEDEGGDTEVGEDDDVNLDYGELCLDGIDVDNGTGNARCYTNPSPKSKKPKKPKWRACNGRSRNPNVEDVQRPEEARNTSEIEEGSYHIDEDGKH
ncbi:hypothetical protein CRG98_012719 [Punica granatum]|uniref:Uncharacterized protein n=1 Tax=Punica granatum TaxID=22663 RepID=A0A2I0KF95_PUNGR|nr:hypothetical protein CRG98_012719 [Punica granatum]